MTNRLNVLKKTIAIALATVFFSLPFADIAAAAPRHEAPPPRHEQRVEQTALRYIVKNTLNILQYTKHLAINIRLSCIVLLHRHLSIIKEIMMARLLVASS